MSASLTAADQARRGETAGPGHQAPGPRGPVRVHRPERSWPHPPDAGTIELLPPPSGPDEDGSHWASALPPVLSDRRARAQRWTRVQERYREHLETIGAEAAAAAAAQRAAAEDCFPEPDSLAEVAARGSRLWERRPGHADFGSVRLGRGDVPALCPVRIRQAPGSFAGPDPDLADAADAVVREFSALRSAPVAVGLGQAGSVAVVGPAGPSRALVAAWLAGLATFHAPSELRITGLVPPEAAPAWDWLKWLPHTRDPETGQGFGRVSRAVTTDPDVFAQHADALARRHPGDREHVIVIVDGYRPGQGPRALEALLAGPVPPGITVILLARGEQDVPAACGAKVCWEDAETVRYVESGPDGRVLTRVWPDSIDPERAGLLARVLAPLALRSGEAGTDFAGPVRLVELLGADDAADLDVAGTMLTVGSLAAGVPPEFLCVPVGRTADGEPLSIDLKGAGPHGLVTGAPGAGKSELLRSFAAALAVRHDAALVNLLLADFTGGASFADLAEFPHVAGVVTRLADDPPLADRLRLSLAGELTRRTETLRDAGFASIAEYHQAQAQGAGLAPLPSLVIVVDEFDDLLAARPGLLDTFTAVARNGRTLGLHLLLAARRPDGGPLRELDPQLGYRICLRTASAEDSRAVLGTADAASLPALPGTGYLRVNGALAMFRSAVCGTAPARRPRPADGETSGGAGGTTGGGADAVLRPLSLGSAVVTAESGAENADRAPDARVLARRARQAAPRSQARRVWTAPLPRALTLGTLSQTLGGTLEHQDLRQREWVAAGLVDRPEQAIQEALWYSPQGPAANLGLAGAPGTGKSAFLRSLLLALCSATDASQRQFYCLDLGGGELRDLASLPHVGAVAGCGEAEAAARLFRDLRALLDERASRGQSPLDERWPDVYLVIDDAGQLWRTSPELERELVGLATAGAPYGLHVIVTVDRWPDLRPELLDALGTRWELRLDEPGESLAGRQAAARVPSGIPGRGLTADGNLLQIAYPSLRPEPGPGDLAAALAAIASSADETRAPRIEPLPSRITSAGVPGGDRGRFPLGVSEFRGRAVRLDLAAPGSRLLVYGDPGSGRTTLLRRIADYLLRQAAADDGDLVLHIVDPRRGLAGLAGHPAVGRYAPGEVAVQGLVMDLIKELTARATEHEAAAAEGRNGPSWTGPGHVLLIDDYDLLASSAGSLLSLLTGFLAQGPDIGFSVVLAQRATGSQQPGGEPFAPRLREVADHVLVLSGLPDEGPLAAGITARPLPPGRGTLASGHAGPQLVQCALDEE